MKGILPLFLMKSMLFGTKLVSVPFAPYCGVCADSEIIRRALIEEGKKITEEHCADYLELRQLKDIGLATNNKYLTLVLELSRDSEMP